MNKEARNINKRASIYTGWTEKKGVYDKKAPPGIVLLRLLGTAPFGKGKGLNRKNRGH